MLRDGSAKLAARTAADVPLTPLARARQYAVRWDDLPSARSTGDQASAHPEILTVAPQASVVPCTRIVAIFHRCPLAARQRNRRPRCVFSATGSTPSTR